jgi:hypothetical protein
MSIVQEDLLKPTLGPGATGVKLYSYRSLVLVSFFGGPIASVIYSSANSRSLKRLNKDLPFYFIAVLLSVLAVYLLLSSFHPLTDSSRDVKYAMRMAFRAGGLLTAGGCYLLHKPYYRALDYAESHSPWKWAIISLVLSMIISSPIVYLLAVQLEGL